MEALEEVIKEEIRLRGPITFERFMELALYHPEYGYYSSGAASIGKAGDFYTSSQATGMYGTLMAEVFAKMSEVSGPDFVEMGAGEGVFANDFLHAMARLHPEELQGFRYFIVERSPGMVARQKALLKEFKDVVVWTDGLEGLPDIDGVFFSNELLDAFPFHKVKQESRCLKEIYVGLEGDKLIEATGPVSTTELATHLNRLSLMLPDGMVTEVNLNTAQWTRQVSERLRKGFVVTVDYGYPAFEYYDPRRMRGTALCYYRHSANEDFLGRVGEQDITAHVDFTTVAAVGGCAGLEAQLFCDQGSFLAETLAWYEQSANQAGLTQEEMIKAGQGIKTLIHPDWMGGTFKVLVQSKETALGSLFGMVRNRVEELRF